MQKRVCRQVRLHYTNFLTQFENGIINKIICSFKSFVQQAICQAKDLYHDLKEAIEYVESKEQPQTESQSKKVSKLADTFSVYSKYVYE